MLCFHQLHNNTYKKFLPNPSFFFDLKLNEDKNNPVGFQRRWKALGPVWENYRAPVVLLKGIDLISTMIHFEPSKKVLVVPMHAYVRSLEV